MDMKEIAVFGGTFNPVHKGHTEIIGHLKNKFGSVAVIPCGIPPHKNGGSAADRLNMLKLAVPEEIIDMAEIDSPEISYTYKTLEEYSKKYDKIYFCIGSDSFFDITGWMKPGRIMELASIYVIPRPGSDKNLEQYSQFIRIAYNADIIIADITGENISSTEIRLKIGFGDYSMLSEGVARYIKDNNLYSGYKKYTDRFSGYRMTPNRIRHTLNTALMSVRLAQLNRIPTEQAVTAALLHDIAKNIGVDESLDKGYINNKEYNEIIKMPETVRHSFIGAKIAEKDFDITDSEILDAVKYHTTGRPGMSQLEKVIFLADYTEEDRRFENIEYIRAAAMENLDRGITEALGNTLYYLKKNGKEIDKYTIDAYNFYMTDDS